MTTLFGQLGIFNWRDLRSRQVLPLKHSPQPHANEEQSTDERHVPPLLQPSWLHGFASVDITEIYLNIIKYHAPIW